MRVSAHFETERCLRNVKTFSKFHYIQLSPMEVTRVQTKWRPSKCVVRVWATEYWQPLHATTINGGFIHSDPYVAKAPTTRIECPICNNEVTNIIASEETRINSTGKMASLYTIRENGFRSREEAFHWDLRDSVELGSAVMVRNGVGAEDDDNNP